MLDGSVAAACYSIAVMPTQRAARGVSTTVQHSHRFSVTFAPLSKTLPFSVAPGDEGGKGIPHCCSPSLMRQPCSIQTTEQGEAQWLHRPRSGTRDAVEVDGADADEGLRRNVVLAVVPDLRRKTKRGKGS